MTSVNNQKIMAIWLFLCCAAIFSMVILGGVTRLTGSGLSMVEWAPITGMLPPLSQSAWLETFELYKQFPEYQINNYDMDLDGFKSIFWFEYSHRVLGRMIGILFFFPMVFFFFKGWVSSSLKPKLIAMFILGGLQGLLGWYMVKSGLVNNPHVSQYRLTAHLSLALIVYAYIFWMALSLFFQNDENLNKSSSIGALKPRALYLSLFVFITALSGGFVAGLKAGHAYNTFPLMNGQLIPEGLFSLAPVWVNFFENVTTVQFDHRLLATTLFIAILIFYAVAIRKKLPARVKIGLHLMLTMLLIQVTLGISTLLLHVPNALAASHQGGALLLFTCVLFVAHQIRRV
ncbi:MAG: COX15/CtaA family protein [Gammaproteobacteria bacterium]|nr:COX15/CtaA family protein [Gammaproteobacteria bacterium]